MEQETCDGSKMGTSYSCVEGKPLKELPSLDWSCPFTCCKLKSSHIHDLCENCYKYAKFQLDILIQW